MRKNTLEIRKRIELENMVMDLKNNPEIDTSDDLTMAKSLRLKVEYCSLAPKTEAKLCPADSDDFLGIIKIDKKYKGKRFALTHEIARYILDVGVGNKVEETYVRNTENNTKFGWFWKRA